MDCRTTTGDVELESSTAPTTPDGSLTFSPALQALKLQDALEKESMLRGKETRILEALEEICPSSEIEVKNICCIGAGYVGKNARLSLVFNMLSVNFRWTDCSCYGIS